MMRTLLRPPTLLALAVLAWAGISPALAAYTDHGDGTVTDTATGLMWDKCSWGQTNNADCSGGSAGTYTWQPALALAVTANAGNYKGHNDWRLPNVKELESIVKIDAANPAIDTTAFPNTVAFWYWSSTPNTPDPADAWVVVFNFGFTIINFQTDFSHVRLVRSGQLFAPFDAFPAATAPTMTSGTPPGGTVGSPYSFTVTATESAPITFSATGLPAGLGIDPATGAITGTPTAAGSSSVVITATNAGGTATLNATIVIAAAGPVTPTSVPTLSEWGTILLSLLLAGAVVLGLKRRG